MQELSITKQIASSASVRILYLPHAIRQMSRPDRMITTSEVREVIKFGEIIEDYPSDVRGHSCLIFKYVSCNRPIHVACSPKPDYLAVITAYIPNNEEWKENYRKRKLNI